MDDREKLKHKLTDIEWRLDNLYYIKDKRGRLLLFKRNRSQMNLWKNRHYLNIILKDRQRGFSTFIAILILDTCIFSSNQECGIVDITLTDAKKKLAKIKFAYDRLPDWLRAEVTLTTDAKESLEWSNGSAVNVGTSHRGGTLQILHISEAGKISARNPDRAKEIRTGALNTIAPGCWIFNESTAEGAGGEFFEDCETAQTLSRRGDRLTHLDYKFHFFGWWMGSYNELDPQGISISREDIKYFDELEETLSIVLSDRKRAWYVKKRDQQKGDMLREYPSSPAEAFQAAIDGAYLAKQMEHLEINGQLTTVPYDSSYPVNSAWDFGISDHMVIWLHQYVGLQHRLIGYFSGTDEDLLYYWKEMQKLDYIWGRHYFPHDAAARRIGTSGDAGRPPKTIEQIMAEAGMRDIAVVPRTPDKYTSIQQVRRFVTKVFIDETECKDGIYCLKNFRREWDDKLGVWKNRPRHDSAMHGYDGFECLVRGIDSFGKEVHPSGLDIPLTAAEKDWRDITGYDDNANAGCFNYD